MGGARQEARLRALHDLIPDAREVPDFFHAYLYFVRNLRQRLHPPGAPDLREVKAGGLAFTVDLGDRLGADFFYGQYAELLESELFLGMIEPGGVVVDVGANFGYYAVRAAQAVGPSGRVHAFEPDPRAFALLERNVRDNGFENVRRAQAAVGDRDGEVLFHVMQESAFSSLSDTGRSAAREVVRLPITTLDEALDGAAITAAKVDVEGHEFAVLRGARQTLDRSPDALLMLEVTAKNLDAERRAALHDALAARYAAGATGWVADTEPSGLRAVVSADEAVALGSANLFLVRAGGPTEARLLKLAGELRQRAFHGFAEEMGLDAAALLRAHPDDPRHGLRLHAAFLGATLRRQEARAQRSDVLRLTEKIEQLVERATSAEARLRALEQESQARIEHLRQDGQARLEEIHRQVEKVQQLKGELHTTRGELEAARAELATVPGPVRSVARAVRGRR